MLFEVIRQSTLVFLVVGLTILTLRYVFNIRVRLETKDTERSNKVLAKKYRQSIRHKEQVALEKIIDERVAELQKRFGNTVDKMETYANSKIEEALAEELLIHKKSAEHIKQLAEKSVEKSAATFAQMQDGLAKEVDQKVEHVKAKLVAKTEEEFVDIIRFYVEHAIRDQVSADSQIETVISRLEQDKQQIIQDLANDA